MRRVRAVLLALGVLMAGPLACNLTRAQPTPTPNLSTATFVAPPTLDPNIIPSLTPIGGPTATPLPGTPSACVMPTDWFIYIVQPGDTLTDIASRVGSTVQELVTRNCLPNGDAIFVGQALYVPIELPPIG
ncbi:MAG TPA: LysM domain-containing protein [Candidatus Limnocylindrales bacterium]|nr:LysM domain-containing protein [Candidatus Limnocylindrales bacterium]